MSQGAFYSDTSYQEVAFRPALIFCRPERQCSDLGEVLVWSGSRPGMRILGMVLRLEMPGMIGMI